jgi:hypothetical protein
VADQARARIGAVYVDGSDKAATDLSRNCDKRTSPEGRDADVTDQRDVLTRAYAAFNARDIDAVLAAIEILHHKRSKERSKAFLHPREIKSKAGRHYTQLRSCHRSISRSSTVRYCAGYGDAARTC